MRVAMSNPKKHLIYVFINGYKKFILQNNTKNLLY